MLRAEHKTESGKVLSLREMTFGEVRTIRDKGDELPIPWPLEQQLPAEALDALPHSEAVAAARAIYDLTYGTPADAKNS
jgi:hypothetical protein